MIKIVHLYSRLLNLYGEYANVDALVRMLTNNGIKCEVKTLDKGEYYNLSDADFIYVGSGTKSSLVDAVSDVRRFSCEIGEFLDAGKTVLATGNAGALFMKALRSGEESREALGILDIEAREVPRRYGDVICTREGIKERIVGSYNSDIEFGAREQSMFGVLYDSNGKFKDCEGIEQGNVFVTQLIGPLLQRNCALCERLAARLCNETELNRSGFDFAERARENVLRELMKKARIKLNTEEQ